jgi:acyl-CoA synthetase (AMP-forming)/AMP-acid ligase II
MLYERWRQIAGARLNQIAVSDLATGTHLSFRELAAAGEARSDERQPIVFPQGASTDFIVALLGAWRARQIACPLEIGQPAPEITKAAPPDIVHLKTTSATTGNPRLVAFTAAQLLADAENIVATMGLRPDWPNLGVISLAHSYGFSNLVLPLLLHGIPLILVGSVLPEALRRAAAAEPDVTLPAVPALWRSWHEAEAIPDNVRLAISAGAPLPLHLEQSVFADHGLKIRNFYGSSECGGIAFDAQPGLRLDGACVGSPARNVQISVADDGCLEVRSPAVAQGYWPESDPALGNGVFHTSDRGELAFGLVYLRGRAGDQINVAGRKVSPETIEKALTSHAAVRECLAFGVPSADPQRGEIIVVCLAVKEQVTGEALKQFLMANLPAWQVPREWWFVDSLETNQRGKLSRADWRKRYLEGIRPNGTVRGQ